MREEELIELIGLLRKLRNERKNELIKEYDTQINVLAMSDEEIYDIDDYYRLIEGCDIVIQGIKDRYHHCFSEELENA